MPDAIDAAIADAEPKPQRVQATVKLLGRDQRLVVLDLPADISDLEWLGLIGALLGLGDQIRAQRPNSRLVLPA